MSGRRNGQIRFEAWVPEDLFRAFSERTDSRKGWLVAAMRRHVARTPVTPTEHVEESPDGSPEQG